MTRAPYSKLFFAKRHVLKDFAKRSNVIVVLGVLNVKKLIFFKFNHHKPTDTIPAKEAGKRIGDPFERLCFVIEQVVLCYWCFDLHDVDRQKSKHFFYFSNGKCLGPRAFLMMVEYFFYTSEGFAFE